MADEFQTNLLRLISAELAALGVMQVARELFGKSYFSLSAVEKATVDQMAHNITAGHYHLLTPEFLQAQAAQQGQPVGFQGPSPREP